MTCAGVWWSEGGSGGGGDWVQSWRGVPPTLTPAWREGRGEEGER